MHHSDSKNFGFTVITTIVLVVCGIILVSSILAGIHSGRVKARDAQRVKDIQAITQALKVYFDYNQKYPQSAGTAPKDFSTYLSTWPTAPSRDGKCTEAQNSYNYSQASGGESYRLSFCLSSGVGDYPAGYQTLLP